MPTPHRYILIVEGFVLRDDQYLTIIRSDDEDFLPGILAIPGGKVEVEGEHDHVLEETLRREIREETGIEVEQAMTYVESTSFTYKDNQTVVGVVFLCRYKSGELTILDPSEVAGLEWMSAGQLLAHPNLQPWTRRSLLRAEAIRNATV